MDKYQTPIKIIIHLYTCAWIAQAPTEENDAFQKIYFTKHLHDLKLKQTKNESLITFIAHLFFEAKAYLKQQDEKRLRLSQHNKPL